MDEHDSGNNSENNRYYKYDLSLIGFIYFERSRKNIINLKDRNAITKIRRIFIMNILVLGNGFDLAHELPTKYTDFLEYIETQEHTENINMLHETELILRGLEKNNLELIGKVFRKSFRSKDILAQELEYHRLDNIWIEYFIANSAKENWIGFEREIYKIIRELNDNMGDDINKSLDCVTNSFIRNKIISYVPPYIGVDRSKNLEGNFGILRDRLVFDLNRLIRALEIYLCICVEKIPINIISPDIDKLKPDKVLSFNYTNTYEKLYGIDKEIEYDYIHGKTDINNTIDSNNMVLGIDEYLKKKHINKNIEFIEFKKYYQRIHKETGSKYRIWIEKIKESWNDAELSAENYYIHTGQLKLEEGTTFPNKVYFFGHSLDVTDKDIIKDLILHDNVQTTIYYCNKEVFGQQIANLVKVIGHEELIKRTGGTNKTIIFKAQQEMIKRKLN